MTAKHLFSRRALAVYFVMGYSSAWMSLLGLAGFNLAADLALTMADTGVMSLAMLAGPSKAVPVMAAVVDGRASLCELWARCLSMGLPARWYARVARSAGAFILPYLICSQR